MPASLSPVQAQGEELLSQACLLSWICSANPLCPLSRGAVVTQQVKNNCSGAMWLQQFSGCNTTTVSHYHPKDLMSTSSITREHICPLILGGNFGISCIVPVQLCGWFSYHRETCAEKSLALQVGKISLQPATDLVDEQMSGLLLTAEPPWPQPPCETGHELRPAQGKNKHKLISSEPKTQLLGLCHSH